MSSLVDGVSIASVQQQLDSLASFNRHVAHDLRGPLVSLACAAQRALQAVAGGDIETAAHVLQLLAGRAESLTLLVSELLALAEATEAPLQFTSVDLNATVRSAIDEALLSAGAAAKVEIRLQPLPVARGAAGLLRQVLVNLIANAVKFSRYAPQPVVEIGVMPCDAQRAIYVRDNGIGFDDAQAERLFQPFARLHGREYVGHGIGLSFVKRVVERHGGRVWAAARAPAGATFCFTLAGLV